MGRRSKEREVAMDILCYGRDTVDAGVVEGVPVKSTSANRVNVGDESSPDKEDSLHFIIYFIQKERIKS